MQHREGDAPMPVKSADPAPFAPETRRLHVFFSGSVQGVGFRYTARAVAERFSVHGWVRNRSDGRVELVAEGRGDELESYLAALGDDMSGYIREVERSWEAPTDEFNGFQIAPSW
jgi:acylphosphatase